MAPVCYYCKASLPDKPTPKCSQCNKFFTPFYFAKTYGERACSEWLEEVHNTIAEDAHIRVQHHPTDRFILACEKEYEQPQRYFEHTEGKDPPPTHPYRSLARLRSVFKGSRVPLPRGVMNHIDFIHRFAYLSEKKDWIEPVENLDVTVQTFYPTFAGVRSKYNYGVGTFYDPTPIRLPPEPKFDKVLLCMDTLSHLFIRPEFLLLTKKYLTKLRHLRNNYSALEYTPQYLRLCLELGAIDKETYMKYMKDEEMRYFCAIDMIAVLREWQYEFVMFTQDLSTMCGGRVETRFKKLLRAWAKLCIKFFDIQSYYGMVIPEVPRVFSDDIYYRLKPGFDTSPLALHIQNYRNVRTEEDVPKLVDAMFTCKALSIVPHSVK